MRLLILFLTLLIFQSVSVVAQTVCRNVDNTVTQQDGSVTTNTILMCRDRSGNWVHMDNRSRLNAQAGSNYMLRQAPSRSGSRDAVKALGLVREIQRHLKALGYNVGEIDGVFGGRTALAIGKYQKKRGLRVNGRPSSQLLSLLQRDVRTRSRASSRRPFPQTKPNSTRSQSNSETTRVLPGSRGERQSGGRSPNQQSLASGQGEAEALYQRALRTGKSRYDYKGHKTAAELLRRAAEMGHGGAQYRLANMYRTGKGVPKSEKRAFHWMLNAAKSGNVHAQHNVALSFMRGSNGVRKDYQSAIKWFTPSAEQGNSTAKFYIKEIKRLAAVRDKRRKAVAEKNALEWICPPKTRILYCPRNELFVEDNSQDHIRKCKPPCNIANWNWQNFCNMNTGKWYTSRYDARKDACRVKK